MGDTKTYSAEELVIGFKQNNSKILNYVYLEMYPKVLVYVLKNSGTNAQAKDIFQEAFIACWNNIKDDKYSKNITIHGYLYTIAKNKWTDYLRSSAYKKTISASKISNLTIVQEEADFDEDLDKENKLVLKQAFIKLGNNCKTLLKLFYFERKSMNEISELLKMTSASAKNKKYRCMEKLKRLSLDIKK